MKYTVMVATPEGSIESHSTWPTKSKATDVALSLSEQYEIFTSVRDLDTNSPVWVSTDGPELASSEDM